MPNQRKKGKQKVGLWVDDAQSARLRQLAEEKGLTVSDLIKEAIRLYDMSKGFTKEEE
jgi:hypothetical protein